MKIRLVVSLCFFTLSSTAFGGGGGSSSGGAGAGVDNTPTTLNLAGTWQGKSVVQCAATACNWDIECTVNQNGATTCRFACDPAPGPVRVTVAGDFWLVALPLIPGGHSCTAQ